VPTRYWMMGEFAEGGASLFARCSPAHDIILDKFSQVYILADTRLI
jgi:hypothetical protein